MVFLVSVFAKLLLRHMHCELTSHGFPLFWRLGNRVVVSLLQSAEKLESKRVRAHDVGVEILTSEEKTKDLVACNLFLLFESSDWTHDVSIVSIAHNCGI
jgi:hypothetical protein